MLDKCINCCKWLTCTNASGSKNNCQDFKFKRIEIKKAIKPLCKIFKIKYEYIELLPLEEILFLNGQKIICTGNSVEQIRDKVIGYIFAEIYCKNNSIGAFQKQTLNVIKKDWIE